MADIFISYSRKDLSRVRVLADALSAHGWSVGWDRRIPTGRTFDQVIAEALGSARCVAGGSFHLLQVDQPQISLVDER